MGCSSGFPKPDDWCAAHNPPEPNPMSKEYDMSGLTKYATQSGDEIWQEEGNPTGGGPVPIMKVICTDAKGQRSSKNEGLVTQCTLVLPWNAVKEEGEVFNNAPKIKPGREKEFLCCWTMKDSGQGGPPTTTIYTKEPRAPGISPTTDDPVVWEKIQPAPDKLYPWGKLDANRVTGQAGKPFKLSLCTGDGQFEDTYFATNMGGRFWKYQKGQTGPGTALVLPAGPEFKFPTDGSTCLMIAPGVDHIAMLCMALNTNLNVNGPTFKLPGQ